ncbi:MAG: hypothetical protein KGL39_35570 [Patescibacteria group bacterium]|nr:hypothetical protein [Patescibacteria group bacterium]
MIALGNEPLILELELLDEQREMYERIRLTHVEPSPVEVRYCKAVVSTRELPRGVLEEDWE